MAKASAKLAKRVLQGCDVRGHLWVEGPEGAYLGNGRVCLLEGVREHGSISAAARAMGMSYRHAWRLVDSMNRQAGTPLVVKCTGGRGGGGAHLTELGEQAISTFRDLEHEFRCFLGERTQGLRKFLEAHGGG